MSAVAPREGAPANGGLRPEIQALRAFAVVAVLLYHLWPLRLTGGFVGVDLFFVLSGFLITAHLAKELTSTGTIRLGQFWARRARRLLPASFLVLIATALGTVLLAPQALWQQFFREIGASALYIENWALAADTVDYLAADNVPSPVQHYWSLSVEEQLYLVWPVLLLGVALLATRLGLHTSRAVLTAVALSFVASFAYSSLLVAQGSPSAYFVTPGRVWEFAAGGVLALLAGSLSRLPGHVAAGLAWVGWIGLAGVTVSFDGATPFPGYGALLPVIFTLFVIAAGAPAVRWAPTALVSIRPVQWLGDISYSTYLWHWPLIVLIPYANERALTTVDKVGILIVALALAALTTRFVEDPVRFSPTAQRMRPGVVLSGALVASLVVIGGSAATWTYVQRENDAAIAAGLEREALLQECFGAGSFVADGCDEAIAGLPFTPTVTAAFDDRPAISNGECRSETTDPQVKVCTFGDPNGTPVALLGDSHAGSWFPTLEIIAERNGWFLSTYYKGACGFSMADRLGTNPEQVASCVAWNDELNERFRQNVPYELVVTVTSRLAEFVDENGDQTPEAAIAGFEAAWQPLLDGGAELVVIRDLPLLTRDAVACQEANPDDPTVCAVTREQGLRLPDYAFNAANQLGLPAIDMTDYFCTDEECAMVAGGVLVYRDFHHFTATYARSLAPHLEAELVAAGVIDAGE